MWGSYFCMGAYKQVMWLCNHNRCLGCLFYVGAYYLNFMVFAWNNPQGYIVMIKGLLSHGHLWSQPCVCFITQETMTLLCKSWRRYRGRLGKTGKNWGYIFMSVTTPLRTSNTEMKMFLCVHFDACGHGMKGVKMLPGEH